MLPARERKSKSNQEWVNRDVDSIQKSTAFGVCSWRRRTLLRADIAAGCLRGTSSSRESAAQRARRTEQNSLRPLHAEAGTAGARMSPTLGGTISQLLLVQGITLGKLYWLQTMRPTEWRLLFSPSLLACLCVCCVQDIHGHLEKKRGAAWVII